MCGGCPMRSTGRTNSKPAPTWQRAIAYEALSALNLHFSDILDDLEGLRKFGVCRGRFQRESLETCRATLEETRAWINFEATAALHDREEHARAQFGRIRQQFEKKYEDPKDVLLRAERMRKHHTKSGRRKR